MVSSRRIYTLEKKLHQASTQNLDGESSPLLNGSVDDPDKIFSNALDHELEKICSFYQLKELEIYGDVDTLLRDEESYEEDQETLEAEQSEQPPGTRGSKRPRSNSIFRTIGFRQPRRTSTMSRSYEDEDGDSDDDDDETSRLRKPKSRDGKKIWDSHTEDDLRASTDFASSRRRTSLAFDDYNDMAFSALYDSGVSLKKRTISLYVSICELRSFIQLNKTGFTKVLKKYDKILDRNLKRAYLEQNVDTAYAFQKSTMDHLSENLSRIETAYSKICTKGDVAEAKRELRLHLREHVVWERNTVWREMIGIERKSQAANMGIRQTMLGQETDPRKLRLQGDEVEADMKEINTPIGRYRCPQWLLSSTFYTLIVIFTIFLLLLFIPSMKKPEQQNCLALVIFVSLLWATEVCNHKLSTSSLLTQLPGHPSLCDFITSPFSSGSSKSRLQG